jgi:hypothetical protein
MMKRSNARFAKNFRIQLYDGPLVAFAIDSALQIRAGIMRNSLL